MLSSSWEKSGVASADTVSKDVVFPITADGIGTGSGKFVNDDMILCHALTKRCSYETGASNDSKTATPLHFSVGLLSLSLTASVCFCAF